MLLTGREKLYQKIKIELFQMKFRILVILFLSFHQYSNACSAFFFNNNQKILAKNFDWSSGQGYLLKNLRGQKKFAYGFRGSNVAGWTSKFGSITFNQIGKEFPYGGMNEKGLVIEQLWLQNSEYQENRNEIISELEWIQYQLDVYSNVDEVISSINHLTIKPNATVHFILADRNGVSAVIEFVNGKVAIDRQETSNVVTNSTFEESKNYFIANKNIDNSSRNTYDRYCILRNNLNVETLSIADSFKKLNLVSENQENYKSYWSMVYDLDHLEINFKSLANPTIKKISLSDFNFEDNSEVEFSLVNTDQLKFEKYSSDQNKVLLIEGMKMMNNMTIDIEKANQHQMNPNQIVTDEVYQNSYADLLVEFLTKKNTGNIYYTFTQGGENFEKYNGFLRGIIPVVEKTTRKMFYGIPKIEFAIACYQDTNLDSKMDKNVLGIPTNTGFSNNKKKIFGIPPDYGNAKIYLDKTKSVQIKIN